MTLKTVFKRSLSNGLLIEDRAGEKEKWQELAGLS
jgi:hypothetical protein